MEMMAYLLNMSVMGIKSIEKEIRLDFYGKNVNRGFNPEKYKIKGIYGENGSGKTALINAVNIVKEFVFDENYLRTLQSQALLRELINKKKKLKSLLLQLKFILKTQVDKIILLLHVQL